MRVTAEGLATLAGQEQIYDSDLRFAVRYSPSNIERTTRELQSCPVTLLLDPTL